MTVYPYLGKRVDPLHINSWGMLTTVFGEKVAIIITQDFSKGSLEILHDEDELRMMVTCSVDYLTCLEYM